MSSMQFFILVDMYNYYMFNLHTYLIVFLNLLNNFQNQQQVNSLSGKLHTSYVVMPFLCLIPLTFALREKIHWS